MLFLISIDGMRPDGMMAAHAPTMHRMVTEGTSSLTAQTLMPCCTLPCHTSMLRGTVVARHGITTNTFHPLVRPVPSILDVASAAGKRTGAFFNWGPSRDLFDPESVEVSVFFRDAHRPEGDDRVTDAALAHPDLDFAFVYLGHTDEVGHRHGWMSSEYLAAIENADRNVARLLAAHPEANVLLMSDHGGHDRTHGTTAPEDMTIPFVLYGPRFHRGLTVDRPIFIQDAAPTLAHILSLALPNAWDGTVVHEAFLSH